MKVLIGIDGSAGGFAAVREAGRLLSAARDQVTLYYSPPLVTVAGGAEAEHLAERARNAMVQAVFDEARAELPAALREAAVTMVGTKHPRQGILLAAEETGAELIAVGARGAGPIESILVGSVSAAVATQARVPVLVVRTTPSASLKNIAAGPVVLWASDGSAEIQNAGALLNRFSWPETTSGQTMTVIEPLLVGKVPEWLDKKARAADSEAMASAWVVEHEADRNAARKTLDLQCAGLPPFFARQPPLIAEGHAAEQILKTIADHHVDIVVIGSHGDSLLERYFLGSTSRTILAHAPCSVLLMRKHETP